MAKPKTPELEEFFGEHLPYEINMFRASYLLLGTGLLGAVLNNALIESFCVHARNLIEFFKTKDSCDFDPRAFTVQAYALNKRFIGDSILPKITNQISHLTVNRTSDNSKKIGSADRKAIAESVEREIARFKSNLTPDWLAKCKFDAALIVDIGGGPPSSTNAIIASCN